jgi:hypothetical protein
MDDERWANQLIEKASESELRTTITAELHLFLAVFRSNYRAANLMERVSERLKQLSGRAGKSEEIMKPSDNQARPIKRDWHPVYCPLHSIVGFESQKERASALLKAYAYNQRSVVFLALDEDWVYGQCNFKMNSGDGHDLKFVDSIETVINRNLKIFASGGVRQLLFTDRGLRDKMEDGANAARNVMDLEDRLYTLSFKLVKELST